MQVYMDGYLSHLYWRKKIKKVNVQELLSGIARGAFSTNSDSNDILLTLDTLPQEYPAYGNTDFRTPAYSVQLENGTTITDLRYKSHRIIKGKPALKTSPATYVESDAEAETLEIYGFSLQR